MKSVNALHRAIFRWFKPYMVKLAYTAPVHACDMELAFHDEQGRRYFKAKEMPIVRKLYIADTFTRICTGIREQDISASLEAIEKAINEKANGKMRPNIAMVSYICRQLLSRSGFVLDMDLIYQLAALYYIREDEHPEFVNLGLLPEKIEAIRKTDISQFFFAQSLDKLFPFLADFDGTMQEFAEVSKVEAETFLANLKRFSDG